MIFAIIPYLAAIYIYSVNKVPKTLLKLVTPFLLGFSVSAIPSIFLFVKAPDNFRFGTIQYASLNTQFRFDSGFQGSFTFFEKLRFLLGLILEYPSNLLILIFSMFLGVLYMVYRKPGNNTFPQNCVLPISMVLFLSIGSFLPTPSWPQYFYAPFPFIIIFGAECMSALTKVNQEWMQRIYLTFVIAAVLSISLASAEISRIPLIADKNNWQTTYVQVVGNKLKQTVKSGTILTLSPVYVIEAGLNIYPQLTTGPFAWRTAQFLSREQINDYAILGEINLSEVIRANPPTAILVGLEPDHEKSISRYAKQNGYRFLYFLDSLHLWVRDVPP